MNLAKWIWIDGKRIINQYVDFYREFTVDTINENAEIFISVDSEYALSINGVMLGSCQYDDYPNQKVYDTYQIGKFLKHGKNILEIGAYYQGESSFQYSVGEPGLWFVIKNGNQTINSDSSVLCRQSAKYKSGDHYKITNQLGFGFTYDASRTESPWENAVEVDIKTTLQPRPILKTEMSDAVYGKLIAKGNFIRRETEGTVAKKMQADFLSPDNTISNDYPINICESDHDGVYLLFDLEKEMAGYFTMNLSANSGSVIEIAYGEHLDDLRVRSFVGDRNYAVSYTCKEGAQTFTHPYKRFACRYLQIHIRNFKNITINGVGIISVNYPLDFNISKFITPDSVHNKIFEVSKNTVSLCMHEHYEDCPGREQALYGGDSRFQMLATYYGFGDYKFPKACLDLLAQHPLENGQLRMVAPTDTRQTIPSFSLWWIVGMKEYAEYSKDLSLAQKHWDLLKNMLTTNLDWEKDGIITPTDSENLWHFYEWTPGHFPEDGKDSVYQSSFCGEADFFSGIYHLIFWNAMKSLLELAKMLDKTKFVKEYQPILNRLAENYCNRFWDNKSLGFAAFERGGKIFQIGEYSQILALYSGICKDKKINDIIFKKLLNNEYPIPAMISVASIKYEALLLYNPECAKEVFQQIKNRWGAMLEKGATSFWETDLGADDFEKAGSLCHGWSSIPIYLYLRYAAGIKPDGSIEKKWDVFDSYYAETNLLGKTVSIKNN